MKPTYEELTVQLANAESKCRELAALGVRLPNLPVLGSTAEWYEGFAAGASSMRNECANATAPLALV